MANDDIHVHTTQLQTSSQTAKNGFSDTTNLSNDTGTAISDLVTAMASVEILSGVAGTLETFNTGLMATLECFALGLKVIDNGLAISASAFQGLDARLANTFSTLEGQLNYYTGYDHTFKMPEITVPAGGKYTISTTTLSFQAPSHHSGFWGSVGHFFSRAGHFIAKNALPIGLVAGAVTLVVVGAVLTPVTAGGSDVIADTGAAAMLSQADFALAA
jgi:hypothetical protein